PLLLVLQPNPLVAVGSRPGPERLLEPGLPVQGGNSRVAVARPALPELVHVVDRRAPGSRTDVGDLRVLADPAELHRCTSHEQAPVKLDPDPFVGKGPGLVQGAGPVPALHPEGQSGPRGRPGEVLELPDQDVVHRRPMVSGRLIRLGGTRVACPPVDSRTIDLDGPVHYADFGGDGPTMVLVHGLGGSFVDWAAVGPDLAGRARVVAPDLAGFGHTPLDGRSASVEANRDLLDRL